MIRTLLAAALISSSPAVATEQVDSGTYSELAPEALLPAILAELRHTEPDVYSVRELRLCPAEHIKLVGGKPVDWSVRLEFSSKNQAGGYTGIRREVAIFRKGRIAYPITSPQLGRTGLDGIFARMVDKQMAACKPIPDAMVQRVLTGAP